MDPQQINGLRQIVDPLRQGGLVHDQRLEGIRAEVTELFERGAKLPLIRSRLQVKASLEIERKVDELAAARRIEALLSPSQRDEWRRRRLSATGPALVPVEAIVGPGPEVPAAERAAGTAPEETVPR